MFNCEQVQEYKLQRLGNVMWLFFSRFVFAIIEKVWLKVRLGICLKGKESECKEFFGERNEFRFELI